MDKIKFAPVGTGGLSTRIYRVSSIPGLQDFVHPRYVTAISEEMMSGVLQRASSKQLAHGGPDCGLPSCWEISRCVVWWDPKWVPTGAF